MLEIVDDQEEMAIAEALADAVDKRLRCPVSPTPTAWATAEATKAGSRIAARGTNAAPSAKSPANSLATRSARLVLPTPPGPVSVTNRTSPWRSSAEMFATSSSRPISGDSAAGSDRGDADPVWTNPHPVSALPPRMPLARRRTCRSRRPARESWTGTGGDARRARVRRPRLGSTRRVRQVLPG